MFDTKEGLMDLDFDNMELYKQSGDLCCPMQKLMFTDRMWMAECPSGKAYLIEQRNGVQYDTIDYVVYRIKSCKINRLTNELQYNYCYIGQSEEYNVNH
jgi:hypothetical protein